MRIGGNDFLKSRKEWFANVTNIGGIEVVLERLLERRVQEYKLLIEQKYNLLRELKKGGDGDCGKWVIEPDEDDRKKPRR